MNCCNHRELEQIQQKSYHYYLLVTIDHSLPKQTQFTRFLLAIYTPYTYIYNPTPRSSTKKNLLFDPVQSETRTSKPRFLKKHSYWAKTKTQESSSCTLFYNHVTVQRVIKLKRKKVWEKRNLKSEKLGFFTFHFPTQTQTRPFFALTSNSIQFNSIQSLKIKNPHNFFPLISFSFPFSTVLSDALRSL